MTGPKILIGAATRYIAGRNAVQTVYWKSKPSGDSSKMVKFSKTFKIGKSNPPPKGQSDV